MAEVNTGVENPNEETQLSSGPDFIGIEHRVLDFWQKNQSFNKLLELGKSRPLFDFLDGPITANNPMGVHHARGRALKDIFIRYKSITGHSCRFQNGFDCQGLWVEVEVEKQLGFRGKPDIEAFGLDKFSAACKARIEKFSKVQTAQSIRLGQWMQWDNSYYTHTDNNIEGIWYFLKRCHDKGWLYQDGHPMPWCTRCGTSLSEHEMAGSYKDMSHLAVFVKLRVPARKARILVWTTTPWTLAANAALAVNPDLDYVEVELEGEDMPVILGKQALEHWKRRKARVLKVFKGSELIDLEYEPIIEELSVQQGFKHRIVAWKDVDALEGTGVVHIAPGCGREDFDLSKEVEIKRISPIDEKGDYFEDYGWLRGRNAKDVAEDVAAYLDKNGKLLSKYMHEHSYPVCWRCKNELVFRLVDEWYISCDDIRADAIKAAASVEWQPEYLGKRMDDWLRNMGDWCISRKRFWGLPLPFYKCSDCGTLTVVGSRKELRELSDDDVEGLPELHRPWVDAIRIRCRNCGARTSRVVEVGDCWLDAGIVPYSTRGYIKDGELSPDYRPADWICEMGEQVRLWFYSMLFMGVTISGKAPYKKVSTYEWVFSESGERFSKTGYMIEFDEAAEKMGVDTMRYYFASQSASSDIRFGYNRGADARRQLISLWNIYSFFQTYAGIDKPDLSRVEDARKHLTDLDRWLLARLSAFLTETRKHYENYNTPMVVRELEKFVESLSNWYVRANRRRFWKSGSGDDKLAGYWALYQSLKGMSVVMSPIIPFLTEHIWQECIRKHESAAAESVHHSLWPEAQDWWQNADLLVQAEEVQGVINHAHRLRAESQIKVRQPLAALAVLAQERTLAALREHEQLVLSEINVKKLQYLTAKDALFSEYLELDMKKAGPLLKGALSSAVSAVNGLIGPALQAVLAGVKKGSEIELPGVEIKLPASVFVVKTRTRPGIATFEDKDLFVALDTAITPELEEEGWIRDVLRQCQVLRKDSGFEVQDRIYLNIRTTSSQLNRAIEKYRDLIQNETLGVFDAAKADEAACQSALDLSAGRIEIFMRKV